MNYMLKAKDIENIENHYKKYFTMVGAEDSKLIWHEVFSDAMHIDLVHYLPTNKFPYHIIATVGMSGYSMKNAPYKNVELIMFLPKEWKLEKEDFKNESWYWPIKMLKSASRLPYLCRTFLSVGHTFSMDENNTPFANCTKMCSGLLTYPTWLDEGAFELKYGNIFKKKVNFLCLTAITEDELKSLREMGSRKFIDEILVKDNINDLLVRNIR